LIAAAILAVATFVRLVANPAVLEYHAREGTRIFNWWLYTYGLSSAALLGAARLLRDDEDAKKLKMSGLLMTAAGILLFLLMNVEIADWHSTGTTVTFNLEGASLAEDMTYTLAWGIYAIGLFAIGVAKKLRPMRICALALLCLTAAKAALHDLWALGALYRIGAIVGLAFSLLLVSFLTQSYVLRKDDAQ
jgi:uncharacterized membrane protein